MVPGKVQPARPRTQEWHDRFRGQFNKTKLCCFHSAGLCRYGDQCSYAHSTKDMSNPPDLTKTSLCISWRHSKCPYTSAECPFAHGEAELRSTPAFVNAFQFHRRGTKPAAFGGARHERPDSHKALNGNGAMTNRDPNTWYYDGHTQKNQLPMPEGRARNVWGDARNALEDARRPWGRAKEMPEEARQKEKGNPTAPPNANRPGRVNERHNSGSMPATPKTYREDSPESVGAIPCDMWSNGGGDQQSKHQGSYNNQFAPMPAIGGIWCSDSGLMLPAVTFVSAMQKPEAPVSVHSLPALPCAIIVNAGAQYDVRQIETALLSAMPDHYEE